MIPTPATRNTDIVIVGGGVLGLLSARNLSACGVRVTVIDKGPLGREASWAGGGIMSPLYPWRYDWSINCLAQRSQTMYPALARELERETGIDIQHITCGLLTLDAPDHEFALAWGQEHGQLIEARQDEQLARLEPNLGGGFQKGLWMPDVANVRNPVFLEALKASLAGNPLVNLVEHCELLGFSEQQGGIQGVETSMGSIKCEKTLITAGAWSAGLIEQLSATVPIEPVKGQMLLIKAEPGVVKRVVLSGGRYVIPRNDGHVLVGSSLEKTGFDACITDQAKSSLSEFAYHLIPRLKGYPIVKQWAGLRPGSPAGVPYIGTVPGKPNVFINAGHFRNGLIMAPASAKLITDLMLARDVDIDPAPYRVNR
ncbi:MAG: glycine oxidase ThiO [Gammaproteobacteria bacterium]|nr:MAG: glycine oxidase ThiO [Gammaproteobacteria bacterium]